MSSKHLIKTVGLVLVAALAVGAVVASSAFAGGTSKWEPEAGGIAGVTFTGTGGAATFESANKATITCEKSESKGKFLSATEAEATVKYLGKCESHNTPFKIGEGICENAAAKEAAAIQTETLKAEPGDELNKGAEVGILFTPKAAGSTKIAEFTCKGTKIEVTGGVVCKIPAEKVNKFEAEGEIICKKVAGKPGEQEFVKIVLAGPKEVEFSLTASAVFTEKDAQETTEKLTYLPAGTKIKQTK